VPEVVRSEVEPVALVPPRVATDGAHGRLLTTAIDLFSARGYHGVSVRDISSAMGVNPSSLYAHYASKEDLFSELVYLANEEISKRLRGALLASSAHPADQLQAAVQSYVSFHAEYPLLATIGHNDLHVLSGAALHRVAQTRRDAVDLVLAIIVRGNEMGVFDCAQPWLAVTAIAGMGIRVAAWYRPPGHHLDAGSEGYPSEVRDWMPQFTIEEVGQTFAGYALDFVHCAPVRDEEPTT
jgi:AcrR family transcriptional regulator